MSEEIWRSVKSEPMLEASSLGRVRSIPYEQNMPNGGVRMRQMRPTHGSKGYSRRESNHKRMTVLFRRKTYKIARLVCEAFHGPPPLGKSNVLHLDEDSFNNRPNNLRWGTQKENLNAPGFIEYCKGRTGDDSPVRKGMAARSI